MSQIQNISWCQLQYLQQAFLTAIILHCCCVRLALNNFGRNIITADEIIKELRNECRLQASFQGLSLKHKFLQKSSQLCCAGMSWIHIWSTTCDQIYSYQTNRWVPCFTQRCAGKQFFQKHKVRIYALNEGRPSFKGMNSNSRRWIHLAQQHLHSMV